MTETVSVDVRILDKEYRINCSPSERQDLLQSAHYLDQKMREIRHHGRVIGADRIAVMAALNIAHELLLAQRQQTDHENQITRQLDLLLEMIESETT